MRFLPVILIALTFALPASSQVRFMQLGDPQIGRGCAGSSYGKQYEYAAMSDSQCLHRQARQLAANIEYGIARGVDFFWYMGDIAEANTPYNNARRTAFGKVMVQYQDQKFYFTPGNHDTEASSGCNTYRVNLLDAGNIACTDVKDGPQTCPGTMTADQTTGSAGDGYCDDFDTYGSCFTTRFPLWDTWVVNNAHFFTTSEGLWGWSNANCIDNTAQCMDRTGAAGTSCSANDDKMGRGTSTQCLADEVCEDFAGYDDDMATAFDAFVDNYIAAKGAGTANVIMAAGHYPWIYRDDIAATSDGLDYDGPGVNTWRLTIETALDQTGVNTSATNPFYWLSGHVHQFLCWGVLDSGGAGDPGYSCATGATAETGQTTNGVYWQVYTVSGTADPKTSPPNVPLGNFLWDIKKDGTVTRHFVGAGGQLGGNR